MSAAKSEPFVITRRFAAPRALVWDCYTQEKHLKNWWGPKGFKMLRCTLDLRVGGVFHYGMESPNGQVMWGKWVFHKIEKPHLLANTVAFSDEQAGIHPHPFAPVWPLETYAETTFTDLGPETEIRLVWEPGDATPEQIEAFNNAHAGMNAGCEGTFSQLDAYLETL
ncbi:MAG TPA: SRPBCC domain-containing protein [Rhizomicrobium sp.]|nr:SRPBCC domain-containing protein [Rhizomicrobium sp.]